MITLRSKEPFKYGKFNVTLAECIESEALWAMHIIPFTDLGFWRMHIYDPERNVQVSVFIEKKNPWGTWKLILKRTIKELEEYIPEEE